MHLQPAPKPAEPCPAVPTYPLYQVGIPLLDGCVEGLLAQVSLPWEACQQVRALRQMPHPTQAQPEVQVACRGDHGNPHHDLQAEDSS